MSAQARERPLPQIALHRDATRFRGGLLLMIHTGRLRWRTLSAPALALAAFALAMKNMAALLGVAPGHPLTWIVPAGLIVTGVSGAVWGNVVRVRRPNVYAAIGQGAAAAAARRRASTAAAAVVR